MYEQLLEYCYTDVQRETLCAVVEHGSQRKAANALNVRKRTVERTVQRVKKQAALKGWSPEHGLIAPAAPGFETGRVTRQVRADGSLIQAWYKDQREAADLFELAKTFTDDLPKIELPEPPEPDDDEMVYFVNIGDAHIGMLAHKFETGHDFNLDIASRVTRTAIKTLIDKVPDRAYRIVINDLGDGTHYENMQAETEASGHPMGYDGRYPSMVKVYVDMIQYAIEYAQTKAKYVDVIINRGNHSETNDILAADFLRRIYVNETISVLDNRSVFIPYRMGNTFILMHHAHKTKMEKLDQVITMDYRQDFGEAHYKYIWTAHIHTNKALEKSGCHFEAFNQISRSDNWANENGFRSRKCMTLMKMSKKYGDRGREVVTVEEVEDMLNNDLNCGSVHYRREVHTV